MARYDAQINVTIEVEDEEMLIDEAWDVDDEKPTVEDAISEFIEHDQPTFELAFGAAKGFMVAAERVTYLDG